MYSWSFAKALVSLLQLLYAISSLYRTRGNQIEIYGYAAFGLTVAPYAVMSFVNLLGNMLSVEFNKIYMVKSLIMQEALQRGGSFAGVIGDLVSEDTPDYPFFVKGDLQTDHDEAVAFVLDPEVVNRARESLAMTVGGRPQNVLQPRPGVVAVPSCLPFKRTNKSAEKAPWFLQQDWLLQIANPGDWRWMPEGTHMDTRSRQHLLRLETVIPSMRSRAEQLALLAMFLPAAASLAIVGCLSRWRTGSSTRAQRVWTMMWLVIGFCGNIGWMREPSTHNKPFLPISSMNTESHWMGRIVRYVSRKILKSSPGMEGKLDRMGISNLLGEAYVILLYSPPAIGGLVVVGKMLNEYGACFRVF